eukprot:4850263-Prorocentrum_lima.AAC.1
MAVETEGVLWLCWDIIVAICFLAFAIMVMGHHGKRKFAAIVLSGSTHAGSLVTDETFDCECGRRVHEAH